MSERYFEEERETIVEMGRIRLGYRRSIILGIRRRDSSTIYVLLLEAISSGGKLRDLPCNYYSEDLL